MYQTALLQVHSGSFASSSAVCFLGDYRFGHAFLAASSTSVGSIAKFFLQHSSDSEPRFDPNPNPNRRTVTTQSGGGS